ncbi:unnamed protein product [Cylicocyclus nassatus]|uniref:Receptor L-domain domain-containing protein n=1 Tax=Cylicocyclus nassatus TaxID=53992 RepID=A0AA36H6C4_CYLNA|nr:unnamed protein product [Cylicocyclus nassatus]
MDIVISPNQYRKYAIDGKLQLSNGFFQRYFESDGVEAEVPILQVSLVKKVVEGSIGYPHSSFRIRLSDGTFYYSGLFLANHLEEQCIRDNLLRNAENGGEIIAVTKVHMNLHCMIGKKNDENSGSPMLIINGYELLSRGHPILSLGVSHDGNKNTFANFSPVNSYHVDWNPCIMDNVAASSTSHNATSSKMLQLNSADVSVTPISMLTPYMGNWRICGVCTSKEELKKVRTRTGEDAAGGTRQETIDSTCRSSDLWSHFITFILDANLRVSEEEQDFARWLLLVGAGRNFDDDDNILLPPSMCLTSENEVIDWIYTPELMNDLQKLSRAALLTVRNCDAEALNIKVLNRLPGTAIDFIGIDIPTIEEDGFNGLPCDNEEYFHTLMPASLPPYILRIKEGTRTTLLGQQEQGHYDPTPTDIVNASRFCKIERGRDIYSTIECTHLILDAMNGISNEPNFYDSIKMASTYYKFRLANSQLTQISNMSIVKLVKDAELILVENPLLERIPHFEIENGRRILLDVRNNPLLDTTQLLEECKRKRCPPRIINSVQMPYSCTYTASPTLPSACTNVSDDIDIKEEDLDTTVEVLYGTLMLRSSNWTSFPKLKNLRRIVQRPGKAALVIEDNQILRDLDAVFDIDFSIRDFKTAVKIENNPELCLRRNYSNNPFAQKFLSGLHPCSKFALSKCYDSLCEIELPAFRLNVLLPAFEVTSTQHISPNNTKSVRNTLELELLPQPLITIARVAGENRRQ